MIVRRALFKDLDQLSGLFDAYRVFYKKPSDLASAKNFLEQRFEQEDSMIFVCELEHQLLGFTQLYCSYSSVSLGRVFILNDLFVVEKNRNHGIGQKLITEAVNYGKSVGAVRMELSTERTNTKAQKLYKSMGWKENETFLSFEFSLVINT